MPNQFLPRGQVANLGAGVVPGNLQVIGVGANYTIAIGGGGAVPHVVAVGAVNAHAVNGAAVTVTNTSPVPGPVNMAIIW